MPAFIDQLADGVRNCGSPVLVGLDPRLESLPAGLRDEASKDDFAAVARAYERFCRDTIDAVADRVCVVKPQAAFFEHLGPAGMSALAGVIQHARQRNLLVILDGKRNDIGSTATAYAEGYLGKRSAWGADALTVSPYLGDDSLTPFVDVCRSQDAGIFVLVKTSNPGGKMLQDLVAADRPVYEHIGRHVEQLASETAGACGFGAVGAVVGATYPEQLSELRRAMPHTWFLVPGFGTQGGTAGDVAAAFDDRGLGAIINNSRGIIFAHSREPYRSRFGERRWQEAVAAATAEMADQLRAETPAGLLRPGS